MAEVTEMDLSIVIVNYNTKLLLQTCLGSIQKATQGINAEVINVDNNSTDGSKEYLSQRQGNSKIIFNDENIGFAKACNKGAKNATGKYILFLNPDTAVSQDCFQKCISFFESHKDAGAAGVRMVDEDGKFLKESKRGIPTPAASFYKLFGLASLFPHSKTFAAYYMGNISEKENNPVDILSGAFMMIRKELFEQLGGFDESFFMYGEDIDLSYRIARSGYTNYYLGEIAITHQKGGSTKHNSEYIKNFYGAMNIFVKKYYAGEKSKIFVWMILNGIRIRKMIARAGLLFK